MWTSSDVINTIYLDSLKYNSLYHDLNYAIVIGLTRVTWCAKINNVAQFSQCSVMFPGNIASRDPCSRGTWCKPRDTMHLRRLFGPTAVLGRSIRILCRSVMDDDTNLLHLFRDITNLILSVSLDRNLVLGQHCKLRDIIFLMLPWAPVDICIMYTSIKGVARILLGV